MVRLRHAIWRRVLGTLTGGSDGEAGRTGAIGARRHGWRHSWEQPGIDAALPGPAALPACNPGRGRAAVCDTVRLGALHKI